MQAIVREQAAALNEKLVERGERRQKNKNAAQLRRRTERHLFSTYEPSISFRFASSANCAGSALRKLRAPDTIEFHKYGVSKTGFARLLKGFSARRHIKVAFPPNNGLR